MGKIVQYLVGMFLLFSVTSCMMDEPEQCPSEYTIKVSVKDKNYSNISQISQLQPVDENLPVRGYIGSLSYSLRDLSTGNLYMESQRISLEGDEKFYLVSLKNIPQGKYELTVWGNPEVNAATGVLHPDNSESTDLYVGSSLLNVTSGHQEGTIELERTKGKLLVACTNFPSGITAIEQTVTNLYASVGPDKTYSGNTSVKKTFTMNPLLETRLSPNVPEAKSMLNLTFRTNSGSTGDLIIPGIEIGINRNELTLVSINYNDIAGEWEISALIDNEWTLIHHFKITEL